MSSSSLILVILAGSGLIPLTSAYCRDRFGRYYDCDSGLSYGARIGIGLGVAVGVGLLFGLCAFWRRKQLRKTFSQHRPPALPFMNNNQGGAAASANPYASNPPPPPQQAGSYYANQQQGSYGPGGYGNWQQNQYGQNPSAPANVYQPSMAGAYGNRDGDAVTGGAGGKTNGTGEGDHEHGYEWEQAREAERQQREEQGGDRPPGYEVASNPTGSSSYAPPPGPPPDNIVRKL